MPWSFILPQEVFSSPILSIVTPLTTGSLVGYLVNRECRSENQGMYTNAILIQEAAGPNRNIASSVNLP